MDKSFFTAGHIPNLMRNYVFASSFVVVMKNY
jgi:hypothetical protein